MAAGTFKGVIYTKRESGEAKDFPHVKTVSGNLLCSADQCLASGTDLDAGSTMKVGKLPKGAVVHYSIVTPINSNGIPTVHTNAVTGLLGVSGDTNLFGSIGAVNSSAAPQLIMPIPDGTVYDSTLDPLEDSVDVILTTAAQALVADQGFSVKIFYTVD